MVAQLGRLLNPRNLVVIGGKEAERVVEQCDKFGFDGTIWPVHPSRDSMRGRPCLRSLNELPDVPDAAYVAVNRQTTIDMVSQLADLGAGGAVCYAAGFAEADSENAGSGALQNQLLQAAGDMPIIGPNCYGFVNALEGAALWPDQHGALRCTSGVAVLTQSSNIAINLTMQRRGLPIATVMTVGNQAQQGLSKLGLGWLEDPRITALGLHIEGLDDLKAFEELGRRARQLRKPIVVLKVGRSEQARAAALTHTASLAGSDAAHNALFRRLGMARVNSLEAFVETLKLLHTGGVIGAGAELLSLSCSGGEASLMADAASDHKVSYRPFSKPESVRLKQVLGNLVAIANPLDYNTFIWSDWAAMEEMYIRALEPEFDLALLVNDYPRDDRCDPADWRHALEAFVAAVKKTGARSANVASLPETMPEDLAKWLIGEGIAPLCGLENAIIAAQAASSIAAAWEIADRSPPPDLLNPKPATGEFSTLDEAAAKRALAASGLVVPKGFVVSNMAEIEAAFQNLDFPIVVKALGLAHKSEAGAVALNLKSTGEAIEALQRMAGLSDRFLLEEMAAKPLVEILVGITRDPVCGLMLTLGAGGVLTELLDDTANLLLPTSETDIRTCLAGLKIGRLLEGYRASDAVDLDALIANILCIANYAANNADTLEELDVNPLLASQFGSIAVDALIVKRT